MSSSLSDWSYVPLQEVVGKITSGGTPKAGTPSYYGGDIPFLKINDLTSSNRFVDSASLSITEKGLQNSSARVFPSGTVLTTMYGTIGVTRILRKPMATNQAIAAFLELRGVTSEFLMQLINFEAEKLASMASQTTQANISATVLKEYLVDIPPFPEQQKIASILTSVDEVIENTQKQIDKLQDLKKATMNELLTKGIGHTEFKDSELGRIPKSWLVTSMGEVADFQNGHGFKAQDWSDKGLPIIRIQNLNGGGNFNYFKGEVDSRWHVTTGSLLFAWSGQRGKSFGARLWNGPEGVLNQHIFKVTEDTDLVSKPFLYLLLQHITADIERDAHGFKDSFMHVTKGDVTSRRVILPPHNEQTKIVAAHDAIARQVKLTADKLVGARALKKSLMQDLLTGKVRVTVN